MFRSLFQQQPKGHQNTLPKKKISENQETPPTPLPRTTNKLSRRKRKRQSEHEKGIRANKRPHRRQPLSQEARSLSQRLQELSRQKNVAEALNLYWRSDQHRDEHHACIVVDCCAKTGSVSEAEKIVKQLGSHVNIETQTALLKVYAHAGLMHPAVLLWRQMFSEKNDKQYLPNVRTLNTFLRGCLWTAATVTMDEKREVMGGVVSANEAWKMFVEIVGLEALDASSYEYTIALLCQALCVEEAQSRLDGYQTASGIIIKGKATVSGGDPTSLEVLAVSYVCLARAHVLKGGEGSKDMMWRSCQRALSAVRASRQQLSREASYTDALPPSNSKKQRSSLASGGKRGWNHKSIGDDDTSEKNKMRQSSNESFRFHRLSEAEQDAIGLLKIRSQNGDIAKYYAEGLLCRFLYCSGGGTTSTDSKRQILSATSSNTAAWHSYGMARLAANHDKASLKEARNTIASRHGFSVARQQLRSNGKLDFTSVFSGSDRPVDLELGAGFGDWVTNQARINTDRNYIAVELRADRVAQILGRAAMLERDNLCVVASDCLSFLQTHIPKQRIHTIFVNHPEPPTQTFASHDQREMLNLIQGNDGGSTEPTHMLTTHAILEMVHCLQPGGRIVIVTDNRWYARYLSATIFCALTKTKLARSGTSKDLKDSKLKFLESFGEGKKYSPRVELFEGQPDQSIGHDTEGSYFDRLWRTGAGRHSEKVRRFVLLIIADSART